MTHLTYHLLNAQGIIVLTSGCPPAVREPGAYKAVCHLPANLLNSGAYHLKLIIVQNHNQPTYSYDGIASFALLDLVERKTAYMGRELGIVQPLLHWHTEAVSD